jgi:DNA-nicking Smr family endonuclease
MSKRKDISESDSDLFRRTVGKVYRIENDQVIHTKAKPLPNLAGHQVHGQLKNHHRQSFSPIAEIGTTDILYFKRSGVQQRLMEKLRRGQFWIEKQLDLHGMTVVTAEKSLNRFLESCQQNNFRCVRIIHGKGIGSTDRKPVIKNKLNEWLRMNPDILAFCSAKADDGGTGAVYVLLRNRG